jgi:hypothetical protein
VRSRPCEAGCSRSRASQSDPSGSAERQPSEIPSRTWSVSAFLLSGPSTGPRSSGDVRSEPQPRAKVQGQATTQSLSLPYLFRIFPVVTAEMEWKRPLPSTPTNSVR